MSGASEETEETGETEVTYGNDMDGNDVGHNLHKRAVGRAIVTCTNLLSSPIIRVAPRGIETLFENILAAKRKDSDFCNEGIEGYGMNFSENINEIQ